MRIKQFLMGILGVIALSACSSEEMIPEHKPVIDSGLSRYMSVCIKNADGATRATGDAYEDGKNFENEVKTVRFYFFDENKKGRAVKADGTNFIDIEAGKKPDGSDIIGYVTPEDKDDNIEKILTAVLAINTKDGDNIESLKSMVAIVNGEDLPGDAENKPLVDLDELRNLEPADYNLTENVNTPYNSESKNVPSFVMSSSVYGSDDFQCEVQILPSNLMTDPEDALLNPVEVYVERVLAKVRMSTEWNSDISPITATYNNVKYEAIPLKDKKDGGKAQTTIGGDQIYVIFTGWGLQTVADKSFLFKHVNNTFDLDFNWQDVNNHRSYWALNPNDMSLKNFTHEASTKGELGSITKTGSTTTTKEGDFFYCQENAGDNPTTGLKKDVDLDKELTNRTQAYIGGILVTVKDGKAEPIDIAEWGGTKYEKSSLITAMLSAVNDQIFTREENGTEVITKGDGTTETVTKYIYHSIDADDIELIEEELSVDVDESSKVNTVQNGKRYISRLQLKSGPDIDNKEYFKSNHQPYDSHEDVNRVLKTAGVARVWGGGTTYYFVDIEHIGKTSVDDTKYGVVRNHIYDVRINSVYGLGTPILDPVKNSDLIIKPEKPGPDESFLGVQVYILSWRVVDNTISLDW